MKRNKRALLGVILFTWVLHGALYAGEATRSAANAEEPNIVMIVVDTLRADHLGSYGYDRQTSPNIDALAEKGALFERTYSTSSWTLPACGSLLSGTYPSRHGATGWTDQLRSDIPWLPAMLADRGYHTMAVTSNPFLTRQQGFERGFDEFDDETVIAAAQWSFPLLESKHKALVLASTSATATRRAMELLNQRPDDKPFFLLLHYMDCHADYVPPPPLDTKFDPGYDGTVSGHVQSENLATNLDPRDLAHVKALYDGEIAHVDRHIGQLMQHLAVLKLKQNTCVIVTADHGEELLDHGNWCMGEHCMKRSCASR